VLHDGEAEEVNAIIGANAQVAFLKPRHDTIDAPDTFEMKHQLKSLLRLHNNRINFCTSRDHEDHLGLTLDYTHDLLLLLKVDNLLAVAAFNLRNQHDTCLKLYQQDATRLDEVDEIYVG